MKIHEKVVEIGKTLARPLVTLAVTAALALTGLPNSANLFPKAEAQNTGIAPCTDEAWYEAIRGIGRRVGLISVTNAAVLPQLGVTGVSASELDYIKNFTMPDVDNGGIDQTYTYGIQVWGDSDVTITAPAYFYLYSPTSDSTPRYNIAPVGSGSQIVRIGNYIYGTNARIINGIGRIDIGFDYNRHMHGAAPTESNPLCDPTDPNKTAIPTSTPGGFQTPTRTATLPPTATTAPMNGTSQALPTPLPDVEPINQCKSSDIAYLLDHSGSMTFSSIVSLLDAAKMIAQYTGEGQSRALVPFADSAVSYLPLSSSTNEFLRAIAELRAFREMTGLTAIDLALETGTAELDKGTSSQRILLLGTDGNPNSLQDALIKKAEAEAKGYKVIVIGIGSINPSYLKQLDSRGLPYIIDKASNVFVIGGLIANDICSGVQEQPENPRKPSQYVLNLPFIASNRSSNPQPAPTASGRITPTPEACSTVPVKFPGHKSEKLGPGEKGKSITVGRLCAVIQESGLYELSPFLTPGAFAADDILEVWIRPKGGTDFIQILSYDFAAPDCGSVKPEPVGGFKQINLNQGTYEIELRLIDKCGDKIGMAPINLIKSQSAAPASVENLDLVPELLPSVQNTAGALEVEKTRDELYQVQMTPTPTSTATQ